LGCDGESCDYPDYGFAVGEAVSAGRTEKGVAICTSGIGICMAANKVAGIRAALCDSVLLAKLSRAHNDANVLCLGASIIDETRAKAIVSAWLITPFDGGRHERRTDKLNNYRGENE
jgi:ribose 5-phosphate isomerase B